ncbi:NUDIX hydrolase [Stakelama saccharophila]|uniref:NUDIX domain-containing protein n=1 Tax=Stakelama saccharophila TaxID=3075605 RepID=A0ABZ0BAL2_9SPHN|nr:NUDIX domain-containing protein [Stakelama sp. W311]WNO54456.1 NUDIX domain-containing protein [Stakelama sp. W311]
MARSAQTPIPAATVVVMREREAAAPELLIVERARDLAFAGGALVFPGGRIDPADRALAEAAGPAAPDDAEARIAAIRETIEEAGIAVGFARPMTGIDLKRVRAGLHEAVPLVRLLPMGADSIAFDALVPFARWCPEMAHARIFDTRFYLARLPDDAPEPVVDGTENVRAFWATARDVLDRADRGDGHLIFPTRRNLERLALFGSFAEAAEDAVAHPVRTITPWIEQRADEQHLCIPEDRGYPVTSQPVSAAFRG